MKLQAFDSGAARAARRVLEYNPYHGKDGRFTGKSGAASTSVYAGRPSLGNRKDATAAEVAYRKGAGVESPRLRQDNRAAPRSLAADFARGAAKDFKDTRLLHGAKFNASELKRMTHESARAGQRVARRVEGGDKRSARPEHRERVPQDPKKYTRRGSSGRPLPREWMKGAMADRKRNASDGWSPRLSQAQAAADYTPRALRSSASNEYRFARRFKQQGNAAESAAAVKRAKQYTADAKAGKVR